MDSNKPSSNTSASSKFQPTANKSLREIWLAGGCFWGLEAYLAQLKGVIYTEVGYANGKTENPTYEQVTYHKTGHAETVYVKYDSDTINLATLLTYYFKIIEPTSLNRQGNDVGIQYRTGIYYKDTADKAAIDAVIEQEQRKYTAPIVTEVLPLTNYTAAEEAHQQYLRKNPGGYCHINLSILENDPIAKNK